MRLDIVIDLLLSFAIAIVISDVLAAIAAWIQ